MGTKPHMYTVVDYLGATHKIQAEFMHQRDGMAIFKNGVVGDSECVALFGANKWVSCVQEPQEVEA